MGGKPYEPAIGFGGTGPAAKGEAATFGNGAGGADSVALAKGDPELVGCCVKGDGMLWVTPGRGANGEEGTADGGPVVGVD